MPQTIRILALLGVLVALCAVLIGREIPSAQADAPLSEGYGVICGETGKGDADMLVQRQVERVTGALPTVIVSDEYEGLDGGQRLFLAGIFPNAKRAGHVKQQLGRAKLACEVKKIKKLVFTPKDLLFVGDGNKFWFCFKRKGGALSNGTCMRWFSKGRNLYRPYIFKRQKAIGFQKMTVRATADLASSCPQQMKSYDGSVLRTVEQGPAVTDKAELAKALKTVGDWLKTRTGREFPLLEILHAYKVDLNHDKKPELLLSLRSNDPQNLSIKSDALSLIVAADGDSGRVYELFMHHATKDDLRRDRSLGQTHASILGVLDVNADGNSDVMLNVDFHDSYAIQVMGLVRQDVVRMAMTVCMQE